MGVVSAAAWVWCRVVKKKEKKLPTGRGKPNPGPNIKTGRPRIVGSCRGYDETP